MTHRNALGGVFSLLTRTHELENQSQNPRNSMTRLTGAPQGS